jgi:hypothetical protein
MTFAELLNGALAAIEREAPHCARDMSRALGAVAVGITVDRDAVCLRAVRDTVRTTTHDDAAAVHLATSDATVLDLVDGRCDVVDAVELGAVRAWGCAPELEAVDAALRCFLTAAVRSATVRALWARYRRTADYHRI